MFLFKNKIFWTTILGLGHSYGKRVCGGDGE
jgi:hypothetical protein